MVQTLPCRGWSLAAALAGVAGAVTSITYTATDPARPGHRPTYTLSYDPTAAPTGAVAFAHGFGIGAGHYGFVADRLAPLGWVVALPHSAGAPTSSGLALDQAFILEHLTSQSTGNASSPFYGRVPNRTVLMGHSMGGGTSLLAADPAVLKGQYRRPDAIATLSLGTYTIPNALPSARRIDLPALLLTASQDCIDPPETNSEPVLAALRSRCSGLISVVGGSHCQFAAPDLGCSLTERLCGARPSLARETQQELAMQLVGLWLMQVLGAPREPWARSSFVRALNKSVADGNVTMLGSRWDGCDLGQHG